MMAPAEEAMAAAVAAIDRGSAAIEICSTSLGRQATASELAEPAYWGRQILNPVRFADAVTAAGGNGKRIFIEVGPRQALSTFTRQSLGAKGCLGIVACQGQTGENVPEREQLLTALGRLWVLGVAPDWNAIRGGRARRIPLPTYPFERKRYWIDPAAAGAPAVPASAAVAPTQPDSAAAALEIVIQRQLGLMRKQVEAFGLAPDQHDPATHEADAKLEQLDQMERQLEQVMAAGAATPPA